jgi:hypothetical protein
MDNAVGYMHSQHHFDQLSASYRRDQRAMLCKPLDDAEAWRYTWSVLAQHQIRQCIDCTLIEALQHQKAQPAFVERFEVIGTEKPD